MRIPFGASDDRYFELFMDRRVTRVVYDHPGLVGGIIYTSRRVNDEAAVVLFERAAVLLDSPVKYRGYLKQRMTGKLR